jgi:hypothetical protein
MTSISDLNQQLLNGTWQARADAADQLADTVDAIDPEWIITVYDQLWRPIAAVGDDLMEMSGTDPRNNLPSATLKLKGSSPLIDTMLNCKETMVGVTLETEGQRFAYYVDTFDYDMSEKGEWSGTAHLLGIWDILNYLVIWADSLLPIQAQVISYAVFLWAIVTVIENMIAEQSLRIQSGLWEFVNNALSLNPDIAAWFGTLRQSNGNIFEVLKTPVYVSFTNPFLDTSPLICRTVRFESCGAVIKDITRAYGIDVRVDLWLPGDPQPDHWTETIPFMTLHQPSYVVTVKDRSQISGPTGTVLDSVARTVVDLGGSFGLSIAGTIQKVPGMIGTYEAPPLGVDFTPPWAVIIAPEPGQKGSVETCKITSHTPKGWQHIIGGRSPQWLNDLMNATFSWRPMDNRQHFNTNRLYRYPVRPFIGVPEQFVPRIRARRILPAAKPSRPLPSRHRSNARHRQCSL